MIPIECVDSKGNVLTSVEIKAKRNAVLSEIINVLGKYNLTVGQARALLIECSHEIETISFQTDLKALLPDLTNALQQEGLRNM